MEARKQFTLEDFEKLREEAVKQEEENRRADKIAQFLQKVPLRFRGKEFTHFHAKNADQKRIKTTLERYVSTFQARIKEGTSLIFVGNPGAGKTMLSLAMYQALAKASFTVSYEPSLHFLKLLQEKKFESHASFQILLDFYKRIQFLIIDESTEGSGKGGTLAEWERLLLFAVIDARYQEQLCTVLISNRNKEDLTERLGKPSVDRLLEKGITLAFNWESYRQQSSAIGE